MATSDEMDDILELLEHASNFGERLYRLRTFTCRVSVNRMVKLLADFGYPLLPREYALIEEGLLRPRDPKRFLDALVKALALSEVQEQALVEAITFEMLHAAFTTLSAEQVANQLAAEVVQAVDLAAQLLPLADLQERD
jgi:hypothetical protein